MNKVSDQAFNGFCLGFFCAIGLIYLLSNTVSSGPIQQDGLWTCEVRGGRSQCADMKAFTAWWDKCRTQDFERWPMANQPQVEFSERLRQKYGRQK